MKRLLALGMSTVMVLPVLSGAVVFAEVAVRPGTDSSSVKPSAIVAQQDTEVPKPVSAEESKALADRIQKRKLEHKIKLTNPQKLHVQQRCKAAQGHVSSVEGRVKGIETSRGAVYKNVVDHLTTLSEKLKNRGVDTTVLNTQLSTLQGKIDTFNADLIIYKQAVADLTKLDCKADPEAFKVSLEAARAALQKTNDDSKAVKAYIKDTIKPLLKSIRTGLEANKSEANTGGGQ